MSRRDVMKSLLRSAATGASQRLAQSGVASSVRRSLSSLAGARLFIPDARLTAAVARVDEVSAATVSTRDGRLRIDLSFDEGPSLAMIVSPENVTFASHGAKEWSVRIDPQAAALDPRCVDVVAALAAEIARTLWGPFLRKESARGKNAFVHRDRDTLIVDLRSLPDVRVALGQRISAAGIDAFGLQAIVAEDGGLRLVPKLPGLQL